MKFIKYLINSNLSDAFLKKASDIHGNKFNYSLVDYKNSRTKITIICNNCLTNFQQTPNNHISKKQGCPRCYGRQLRSQDEFVKLCSKIHENKYDYSITKYTKSWEKVKIICNEHGIFEQIANNHLIKKCGCPKCFHLKLGKSKRLTKKEFIKKSKNVHKNKFDYSLVEYTNSYTKIKIICKKHGEFLQVPNDHMNGIGCPRCCSSKGEKKIREWLLENKIKFEEQKTFDGLNKMKYDFYLPNNNILIEYDGEQHFKPIKKFGGVIEFDKTKNRDEIKNKFAIENEMKLIRIPYINFKEMNKILTSILR